MHLTAFSHPHSFNDVSFHGSQQIPTPNIDAIANRGLKLMNYHVQPVCSPSRSTFMSGRHVIHTGICTQPPAQSSQSHHPIYSRTRAPAEVHFFFRDVFSVREISRTLIRTVTADMPFPQGTPLRLHLNYSLLPQYLKRCCNYSTHMVGKWVTTSSCLQRAHRRILVTLFSIWQVAPGTKRDGGVANRARV